MITQSPSPEEPISSPQVGLDANLDSGRFPRPELNPWTTPIELPQGRLRLVKADREVVDFSRTEASDVRRACDLLEKHQPREKIERTASGRRGFLTLMHLGQLVNIDRPVALAPPALPLEVGVFASNDWVDVITSGLRSIGVGGVSHVEAAKAPVTERALDRLSLIVMVGELDWSLVHRLMTAGISHVLITPSATSVDVSQVVIPGRTPCLRCVHLHRTDTDPHWPTTARHLADRVMPAPHPTLATLATSYLTVKLQDSSSMQLAGTTCHRIAAPSWQSQSICVEPHPDCPTCFRLVAESAPIRGIA